MCINDFHIQSVYINYLFATVSQHYGHKQLKEACIQLLFQGAECLK